MNLLTNLAKLGGLLDDETKALFNQFCLKAISSDDAVVFVQTALRQALSPPTRDNTVVVEVKETKE